MFEVIKQTINNPFKPEIIDSTTIILKQKSPFVQMSYKYDSDLTKLSNEELIEKVLEDFHAEHYKDKIQDGKILELELSFAKQKENLERQLNDLSLQNELISQALFEITELLLTEPENGPTDEEPEDAEETEVIEEDADQLEEDFEVSEDETVTDEDEPREEGTDGSNELVDGN